jgi:hypothetical protein
MRESNSPTWDEYVHVPDVLTEFHRIDLAFWGDWRTAAVVRCVAAATWCEDRPAKVTGIAVTLSMAASTVHERLAQLAVPQNVSNGEEEPIVIRVTGGYVLTQAGDAKAKRWCAELARAAGALLRHG